MFHLIDDGTLDTVVVCGYCDYEERHDSLGLIDSLPDDTPDWLLGHFRVLVALELSEQAHECPIFADEQVPPVIVDGILREQNISQW